QRRDARDLEAGVDETISSVLRRKLDVHELANPPVGNLHGNDDSAARFNRGWHGLDAEWLRSAVNRKWLRSAVNRKWLRSAVNRKWLRSAVNRKWLRSAVNRKWLRSAVNRKWLRSAVNRKWLCS